MLPKNPFLQLAIPRARRLLERLDELVWHQLADVECSFGGADRGVLTWTQACQLDYRVVKIPFYWGKLFDRGWFRLLIPELDVKERIYLTWVEQGEATLYLEGVPYYGFDVAHRFCPLPPGTREAYVESLCLQSAIWHPLATGLHPRGSELSRIALVGRNEKAWSFYHDVKSIYELALEEWKSNFPGEDPKIGGVGYRVPADLVSVECRQMLRALDDTVNAFDQFGLAEASAVLGSWYQRLAGSHPRIKALLTGHAHIDLVWLWPEDSSKAKAVHTFATMNRLMDEYPEFQFAYSQPASYEAVEASSVPLMDIVRERIKAGRWEVVGASYVESDTLLACGEALARSFLIGQAVTKTLKGTTTSVVWLPDVFGYSSCLPQIMVGASVKYFFTTKLTWSNINRFPYSSFIWRGSDGSEVIAHVTQENGYNQIVSPEELRRGARAHRQSDIHPEFLCPTGYGDGGGGVTEEMCERARRYRSLCGVPEVSWGRVEDFFDRLDLLKADLPVYQGELYLEYHRGTYTTHSDLKAAFRRCERSLQSLEAVHAVEGIGLIPEFFWKRLVFAQFHDHIPGSSVWEVYEEGIPELNKISDQALKLATDVLRSPETASPSLFNPLPLERIFLHGESGQRKAYKLPPLSGVPLASLEVLKPECPPESANLRLSSGALAIQFDTVGRIVEANMAGSRLAHSVPLGQLVVYPDFPHGYEAWDIDRQTLSMPQLLDHPADEIHYWASENEAGVRFSQRLGAKSSIQIHYRIDAFHPFIWIDYDVDWQEEHALLKVHFPTDYNGKNARFGSPFGSVLRGQWPGTQAVEAAFESPASRWAVVLDDGEAEGLAIVTEAKYGFSCRSGNLGVSLLRSPLTTGNDYNHSFVVPQTLRRNNNCPPMADMGSHKVRLVASAFSSQHPRNLNPAMLADSVFTPPLFYIGNHRPSPINGIVGGDSLVPCWVKPADDGNGLILRLHETLGRRGSATLQLKHGATAHRVNLKEEPIGNCTDGCVDFHPYELLSIRVIS